MEPNYFEKQVAIDHSYSSIPEFQDRRSDAVQAFNIAMSRSIHDREAHVFDAVRDNLFSDWDTENQTALDTVYAGDRKDPDAQGKFLSAPRLAVLREVSLGEIFDYYLDLYDQDHPDG